MPVADTLTGWVANSSDFLNAFLMANWMSTTQSIIYLIIRLFNIICLWIIFKKAGRKWRESIIPIWDIYVLCKIAWKKKRFWIFMILPIIWILWFIISVVFYLIWASEWSLAIVIKNFLNWTLGVASLIGLIINLVFTFILPFHLAKKFGKTQWFGVWLLFLTPIFLWILAFWKAEYLNEDNQQ